MRTKQKIVSLLSAVCVIHLQLGEWNMCHRWNHICTHLWTSVRQYHKFVYVYIHIFNSECLLWRIILHLNSLDVFGFVNDAEKLNYSYILRVLENMSQIVGTASQSTLATMWCHRTYTFDKKCSTLYGLCELARHGTCCYRKLFSAVTSAIRNNLPTSQSADVKRTANRRCI